MAVHLFWECEGLWRRTTWQCLSGLQRLAQALAFFPTLSLFFTFMKLLCHFHHAVSVHADSNGLEKRDHFFSPENSATTFTRGLRRHECLLMSCHNEQKSSVGQIGRCTEIHYVACVLWAPGDLVANEAIYEKLKMQFGVSYLHLRNDSLG